MGENNGGMAIIFQGNDFNLNSTNEVILKEQTHEKKITLQGLRTAMKKTTRKMTIYPMRL